MRIQNPYRVMIEVGLWTILCAGAQAQRTTNDMNAEQQQGGYPASAPVEQPPAIPGSVLLDRVVAVINGDVILESDVMEEEQFVQLQPYHAPGEGSAKEQALQHLVNRTLILQQIKEQQNPLQVTPVELTTQLADLRKHLPLPAPAINARMMPAGKRCWLRTVLRRNNLTRDGVNACSCSSLLNSVSAREFASQSRRSKPTTAPTLFLNSRNASSRLRRWPRYLRGSMKFSCSNMSTGCCQSGWTL